MPLRFPREIARERLRICLSMSVVSKKQKKSPERTHWVTSGLWI